VSRRTRQRQCGAIPALDLIDATLTVSSGSGFATAGDPAAVPDAVAAVVGVTPHLALTVTDNIAQAVAGRRMLIVLDMLDAVVAAVETILARTVAVKVLATSRERSRPDVVQMASDVCCTHRPLRAADVGETV
jgi:predicted ATPase